MLTYYVGTSYHGKDQEVRVRVCNSKDEAKGLHHLRSIVAPSPDEAARKYVELITGGTAKVRCQCGPNRECPACIGEKH